VIWGQRQARFLKIRNMFVADGCRGTVRVLECVYAMRKDWRAAAK
jgi:hypothetical protein